MIWATVSSQSCFCWLCRASSCLAALIPHKNIRILSIKTFLLIMQMSIYILVILHWYIIFLSRLYVRKEFCLYLTPFNSWNQSLKTESYCSKKGLGLKTSGSLYEGLGVALKWELLETINWSSIMLLCFPVVLPEASDLTSCSSNVRCNLQTAFTDPFRHLSHLSSEYLKKEEEEEKHMVCSCQTGTY